jgi:mRNA interferase MazF
MSTPRRAEVWNVRFDPAVGAEIQKVRPAVVLSVDSVGRLPLKIVVPITDWKPAFANFAWFVYLPATADNGLKKDSGADAFQVKSLSETRFLDKFTASGPPTSRSSSTAQTRRGGRSAGS